MPKGILWAKVKDLDVAEVFDVPAAHWHITLQFNVERHQVEEWIGKTFIAKMEENCFNSEIQAIKVSLPEAVKGICKNKIPHITVSMEEGISPVNSNKMLSQKQGVFCESLQEKKITCEIEFFEFT